MPSVTSDPSSRSSFKLFHCRRWVFGWNFGDRDDHSHHRSYACSRALVLFNAMPTRIHTSRGSGSTNANADRIDSTVAASIGISTALAPPAALPCGMESRREPTNSRIHSGIVSMSPMPSASRSNGSPARHSLPGDAGDGRTT